MLIKGNLRTNVTQEFGSLDVEASTIAPVNTVWSLGISFDPELSFKKQIDTVINNAIRKFWDQKCAHIIVHSFVIPEIDYCSSLYVSLHNYLLRKLQSGINMSAGLIYFFPLWVATTSYLIELHWLPIKARIEFKTCLLAFKALKFGEPKYPADLLSLQNIHVGMGLMILFDCRRWEQHLSDTLLREHFHILHLAFWIGCLPHDVLEDSVISSWM